LSGARPFHDFLEQTLELWDVTATVDVGDAPIVAIVRAESGAIAWIERTVRPGEPQFRWAVRWRSAGAAPGAPREVRPRLCGSLVGVLSALRVALEVDRGAPLRIAAP
jgi:hypothetical protein